MMKQKDVRIGGEYVAVIGAARVRVRVLREDPNRRPTRFVVARCDTGTVLPKARTAAALRLPRTAAPVNPTTEKETI